MEKETEQLKKLIHEIEKDFTSLDKALEKKQRNLFENKRAEVIQKLNQIEKGIR